MAVSTIQIFVFDFPLRLHSFRTRGWSSWKSVSQIAILFIFDATAGALVRRFRGFHRQLSIARVVFLLHLPRARCINRQPSEAISCSCRRQHKMLYFLERSAFSVRYFGFDVVRTMLKIQIPSHIALDAVLNAQRHRFVLRQFNFSAKKSAQLLTSQVPNAIAITKPTSQPTSSSLSTLVNSIVNNNIITLFDGLKTHWGHSIGVVVAGSVAILCFHRFI